MDNIGRQNWDTQIVIIRYMILGPTLNMRGLIKILRFLILCVCAILAPSHERPRLAPTQLKYPVCHFTVILFQYLCLKTAESYVIYSAASRDLAVGEA